jgi:hypothetical protein
MAESKDRRQPRRPDPDDASDDVYDLANEPAESAGRRGMPADFGDEGDDDAPPEGEPLRRMRTEKSGPAPGDSIRSLGGSAARPGGSRPGIGPAPNQSSVPLPRSDKSGTAKFAKGRKSRKERER